MKVANGFTCTLSQWRRDAWELVERRSFFESLGIASFGIPDVLLLLYVNWKGATAECDDVAVGLGGIVIVLRLLFDSHSSSFEDPEESKWVMVNDKGLRISIRTDNFEFNTALGCSDSSHRLSEHASASAVRFASYFKSNEKNFNFVFFHSWPAPPESSLWKRALCDTKTLDGLPEPHEHP